MPIFLVDESERFPDYSLLRERGVGQEFMTETRIELTEEQYRDWQRVEKEYQDWLDRISGLMS
jgi:hypothetical protein